MENTRTNPALRRPQAASGRRGKARLTPARRRKRRPLPCPRRLARSAAGWPAWRTPPGPTPARRKPTTPGGPTKPTGKCSPPGSAARASPETPPDPEAVGLYLAAQVERGGAELSVATLERRLSGIAWRYRQLGQPLDIRDRHIATVLAGIRRRHARPPLQKAAIFADELLAMLATLEMDLRGVRDRAILAIGFAGGLRRSEIVGLDCGPGQTEDGSGWIEIFPEGALLTIRGKTGWREVEIGRGSRPDTCPVALLETWLRLGRIGHGPLFRALARKNGGVAAERLTDKHVVRLVKTCALAAGLRGDLSEGERRLAFGGHSLRAGLASSAQIEEAHVQKHLGHASAEMTRRYQRKRDRFTINLTKAAGL